MRDTIFGLSTVFGKSGVAIIRISGPKSKDVAKCLGYYKELKHKEAAVAKIRCIDSDLVLDEIILLFFKGPNSFNGEDILELHIHGSIAVINDVMSELAKIDFLRIAEPGEFTKLAFYNGKMDLVAAEGLADLIDSETSVQRLIAQRQINGEWSDLNAKWRRELITVLSQLEAFIDFPEDDIPFAILDDIDKKVMEMVFEIEGSLNRYEKARSIMDGINIVITGAPNVGKSSILNALAKKDVAIVSDIAGTTRDIVMVRMDLSGFAVVISDTAGIREAEDIIEIEGVKRALLAAEKADINIIVMAPDNINLSHCKQITDNNGDFIYVMNKSDLLNQDELYNNLSIMKEGMSSIDDVLFISTKDDASIDNLLTILSCKIKDKYQEVMTFPVITKIRQKKNLELCLAHLKSFSLKNYIEVAAQEIRFASDYLGVLTGKICVEEILDEIFASFCIGK